jgi:hypothetical protein
LTVPPPFKATARATFTPSSWSVPPVFTLTADAPTPSPVAFGTRSSPPTVHAPG